MSDAAAALPDKLFFKIGEVCEITDTQPYVLRYWESEFPALAPAKNSSGQRIYRRRDIETVLRIKQLLYEEGYTIAGAKKKLDAELSGRVVQHFLDSELRLGKPLARRPQLGHAFLEQQQGVVQVGVVRFELPDDLFQAAQVGAEGFRGHGSMITPRGAALRGFDIGYSEREGTAPSETRRVKPVPEGRSARRRATRPSARRATL